ncbi:MAG: UbiX family flavin prenyltransferase [Bacteroidales bacterium]|jgi:4-hydroxy-3-polyprenylbenzoate decarboxylase|nr:UbiX family flavin prenyltransferase [Bacteroidales bacterium]
MKNLPKIIVAVSGASGAIYAKRLFKRLSELEKQFDTLNIVFSENAKSIWKHEIGDNTYEKLPYKQFSNKDFYAPYASGSAGFDTMIVCPCSMGVLGRIANGTSDDLISRAADVILKERKKLILLPRETPFNNIHINNMKVISESGGIICSANPSFYSKPQTINDLVDTVIDRVLELAGFNIDTFRWA